MEALWARLAGDPAVPQSSTTAPAPGTVRPADAAAAWQSYLDFSGKFGGKATVLPDVNGGRLFLAESFGTFKVIYQKAGEIGGVYDADDGAVARQFAEKYLEGQIK